MLKYGFLQTETMTPSNEVREFFLGTLKKRRWNRQFLILLEWCNLGFMFLGSRRKKESEIKYVVTSQNLKFDNTL